MKIENQQAIARLIVTALEVEEVKHIGAEIIFTYKGRTKVFDNVTEAIDFVGAMLYHSKQK